MRQRTGWRRWLAGWVVTVGAGLGWLVGQPGVIEGQLRPLEPTAWHAFDANVGTFFVGVSAFGGQRVALLGREGRLVDAPVIGLSARTGRVVISAQGALHRRFSARASFEEPVPTVDSLQRDPRTDSGDIRVTTAVRLTGGGGPVSAAFRFGVLLPTTDDRVGLERDRMDFFVTLAARSRGRVFVEAEGGAGIHGVVAAGVDQTDPLLFGLGAGARFPGVETLLRLTGQYDTRATGPPRGNEQLAEIQLGVRSLGRTWAHMGFVRGLADFSPAWGLQVRLGHTF